MKTLGIVGGIGPESTIDYYRRLVSGYRARQSDDSFPPIFINSIDMTRMVTLIATGQMEEVTRYLSGEVNKLARAGADVALLASNTPHIVFNEIRERAHIPMISIVEAACEAAQATNIRRAGLFGTRFTMQGSFYPDVFSQRGIQIIVPDEADQEYIHGKYNQELIHGVFREETRKGLLKVADRLIDRQQIDGLILGGTELPLILRDESYRGVPLLDTARIHVERALRSMLA
jgi:aspartate racemase